MAVAERTGLFAEKRKKFRLKKSPAIIYTLLQGHRPHLRYFVVLLVARYRGWPNSLQPRTPRFQRFFAENQVRGPILQEAQYTLQELGTASELQLALPIVIWDNQSLGEIADSMIKAQIKPTAVKAFNPDFSALGAAYGLHTAEPRTVEDLCDAVRAAFQADRPTLIRADAAVLIADRGRFESQVTL